MRRRRVPTAPAACARSACASPAGRIPTCASSSARTTGATSAPSRSRDLTRWLVLRPLMARRKVAIVDGADALNEHGQNALLKTLEEPPGASVLLLVVATVVAAAADGPLALPAGPPRPADARRAGAAFSSGTAWPARSPRRWSRARRGLARPGPRACARTPTASSGPWCSSASPGCAISRPPTSRRLAQTLARGDVEPALDTIASWYRDLLGRRRRRGGDAAQPGDARRRPSAVGRRTRTVHGVLRQLEAVCDTIEAIEGNANQALALETMLLGPATHRARPRTSPAMDDEHPIGRQHADRGRPLPTGGPGSTTSTPAAAQLQRDDRVLVETERGPTLGTVVVPPRRRSVTRALHRVVKKADARDLAREDRNLQRERELQHTVLGDPSAGAARHEAGEGRERASTAAG